MSKETLWQSRRNWFKDTLQLERREPEVEVGIIEEEGRKDAPYIMGRSRGPSRHVDPLHRLEFCKAHAVVKIKCEEQIDTCVQRRKWACSERAYCAQRGWPSL